MKSQEKGLLQDVYSQSGLYYRYASSNNELIPNKGQCLSKKAKQNIITEEQLDIDLAIYVSSQCSDFRKNLKSYHEHPNLAQMIEYFPKSQNFFSVYQYPRGQNLNQYIILFGKTYEDFAISIIRQIAEAINHLHQQQIFHGNVNPTCIYILENKITLINIETQKKPQFTIEKVKYFAPELLEYLGEDFDEKIDVWGLGVVSWRLLFNKFPFDLQAPNTKLDLQDTKEFYRQQYDKKDFSAHSETIKISGSLTQLMKDMLKIQPSERLSISEVLTRLDRVESERQK